MNREVLWLVLADAIGSAVFVYAIATERWGIMWWTLGLCAGGTAIGCATWWAWNKRAASQGRRHA